MAGAVVEQVGTPPSPANSGPPSSGFGAGALKTGNKIFAMPVDGRLVVKLPRQRVDALVASATASASAPAATAR